MIDFSSQNYGPVQVRDLSESLGEAEDLIQVSCIADNRASARLSGVSAVFSQYPKLTSTTESQRLLAKLDESHKRKPSLAWVGALGKSVRGSTPSSVIWGSDFCPHGKLGGVQWLNTATAKTTVEPSDYNNGS